MAATERRLSGVGGTRPSAPTYVGSRDLEVRTMLAKLEPSIPYRVQHLAAPTAGTLSPMAYGLPDLALEDGIKAPQDEGDDLDTVEHARQNRLRGWQTPPDPIEKRGLRR